MEENIARAKNSEARLGISVTYRAPRAEMRGQNASDFAPRRAESARSMVEAEEVKRRAAGGDSSGICWRRRNIGRLK